MNTSINIAKYNSEIEKEKLGLGSSQTAYS
jgi:hypothetical protein